MNMKLIYMVGVLLITSSDGRGRIHDLRLLLVPADTEEERRPRRIRHVAGSLSTPPNDRERET